MSDQYRPPLWRAHHGSWHDTVNGYEIRRVESPVTGQSVYIVASPRRVRLRGEHDRLDDAMNAADLHAHGAPL